VLVFTALLLSGCQESSVKVDKLTFEGVSSIDESALRQVLATQQPGWLPFSKKPSFNQQAFDADLKRITAFYSDHGYPDAKVASVDVRFNDKKDAVRLTVHVVEGEPLRIAAVQLRGFDMLPARARAALDRAVTFHPGEPRDRQRVAQTQDVAITILKERGYPYAKVDVVEEPGPEPHTVIVALDAKSGQQATFGEIEIQGNQRVADNIIRRQLSIEPGTPFRLSRVLESQQRLRSIPLFSFAYVEPRGGEEQPPAVPVRVTIAEAPLQHMTFGVGYGTEDKARARAEWQHVNFLGDARTAKAEVKWSSLDRGVRLGFAEPHLFTRHLSFSAEAQAWDEQEPIYHVKRFGGRGTVSWQRLRRNPVINRGSTTSASVTFIDEYTDYRVSDAALGDPSFQDQLIALGLDPVTGASTGTLVAIRLEALRNTAGQSLDPRRGYFIHAAIERAGGFLPGTFTYYEVTADARHYLPLPGSMVLANRVRVASIDAPEPVDSSVPFFKRYFLGGSTSLRGWGRYEVSPTTAEGTPIGGLSLLEASSELRLPITRTIGMVVFVDVGNVWSQPWQISLGDLRADAGTGFRYNTRIGPIRGDIGYQLTPISGLLVNGEPERRQWRVHLSIGQAF
jgi:outer membrane protein insertion porin family/translocation and assembly module TamA